MPQFIHHIGDRLQLIEGIVAIALGGSRTRGNYTPKSDMVLGFYYQPENHAGSIGGAIARLNKIERELSQWHGDRRLEMKSLLDLNAIQRSQQDNLSLRSPLTFKP